MPLRDKPNCPGLSGEEAALTEYRVAPGPLLRLPSRRHGLMLGRALLSPRREHRRTDHPTVRKAGPSRCADGAALPVEDRGFGQARHCFASVGRDADLPRLRHLLVPISLRGQRLRTRCRGHPAQVRFGARADRCRRHIGYWSARAKTLGFSKAIAIEANDEIVPILRRNFDGEIHHAAVFSKSHETLHFGGHGATGAIADKGASVQSLALRDRNVTGP